MLTRAIGRYTIWSKTHGFKNVQFSSVRYTLPSAEMDDSLATTDISEKVGRYCSPFFGGGELGLHLTD